MEREKMSNPYKVRIVETEIYEVRLRADNEEEAKSKALDMQSESPGKYHRGSDGDISVREISDYE